jgi:ectoine hydroxylase-related dioxygenase (phytanoyl-CoA dioxygenase family)
MPLSDQEVNAYHQDGLVIPSDYRVPQTILARIDQLYNKLIEDNKANPDFSADFILGPHRDDYTLRQVIDDDQLDLKLARDIVLEPGQISLHDVYLVHGSKANQSNKRRMGLVLRIMPAMSFYNHNSGKIKEDAGSPHGYSNRALFLLRGEDKSGRNDFSRGHE